MTLGRALDRGRHGLGGARGTGSAWKSSVWIACGVDAVVEDHLAQVDDHLLRPAQEPLVDVVGRQQRVEDPAQPVAVEPAGEQLDVLLLAREHVHAAGTGRGSGP